MTADSSLYYAFADVRTLRCKVLTEQLLTVQDVASRLRITPETVRRWLRTGKLRGALLGGDKMGYRIAEGEVLRLLDSSTKAATHG